MKKTPEAAPEQLYSYPYPHHAVATDIAVFTVCDDALNLLLIRRGAEPFRGMWALPGGFLKPDEDLDTCARRELAEESNAAVPVLRPFGVFSHPDRDRKERGERVISVAYLALIRADRVTLQAATDALGAKWWRLGALPALAFDHDRIAAGAVHELRDQLGRGFEMLFGLLPDPDRFTLRELQATYEAVMAARVDKSTFRKRVLAEHSVRPSGEMNTAVSHRPPQFYRYVPPQERGHHRQAPAAIVLR